MSRLSLNCLLACVCLHLKYVYVAEVCYKIVFHHQLSQRQEEDILMLQQQEKKRKENKRKNKRI